MRANLSNLPLAVGESSDETVVGGRAVAVHEEAVSQHPFCTLLRFRKDI